MTDHTCTAYEVRVFRNAESARFETFDIENKTVIPDDRHKVQVEVNSEGKTNEATKKLKEPLKEGQTNPDDKQTVKLEKENKKRGRKMS